jgi:hypothetical protein
MRAPGRRYVYSLLDGKIEERRVLLALMAFLYPIGARKRCPHDMIAVINLFYFADY